MDLHIHYGTTHCKSHKELWDSYYQAWGKLGKLTNSVCLQSCWLIVYFAPLEMMWIAPFLSRKPDAFSFLTAWTHINMDQCLKLDRCSRQHYINTTVSRAFLQNNIHNLDIKWSRRFQQTCNYVVCFHRTELKIVIITKRVSLTSYCWNHCPMTFLW